MRWGRTIFAGLGKNVAKVCPDDRGEARRVAIESEIVEDLFYVAVLTARPFSQRFTWISEAFLEEQKPTKRLKAMLFRCTMPVLWRNLEVPNEDVRFAASALLLKFFPLISDDEFIREEYVVRQQTAMGALLMDDCVPIRVMAVKKLPEHLSAHWEMFPRELIKLLLEKLVDQLSLDSVSEVRAAVYEGFEHLLPCPAALNSTRRSLEILAKRGANDRTERVRLAAFKMLNKLNGHRYIKLTDLISFSDCFLRLDYEPSAQIQAQIVRCLFFPLCLRMVKGIDLLERFKRIYFMCKHSRLASLHFHRLVYALGLMPINEAVQHIRSLVIGVRKALRQCRGVEHGADDTTDGTLMNITGASTFLADQLDGETEEKMLILKHVLDSAIILWVIIHPDMFNTQYATENGELTRFMVSVLQELDNFSNTPLMDSALTIASNLPKDKIGRLFGRIRAKLETEQTDHVYFSHFVEALAAWDMNKLISIIEHALRRLRNAVVAVCDPDCSTPRRRRGTNSNESLPSSVLKGRATESPRAKRARFGEGLVDLRRPLELIQMLLASPQTCTCLKNNFGIHLEGFFESLCVIRCKFGELLVTNGWEAKFDARTLISAYETFNIVALIAKKIEQPRRNSQGEEIGVNEAERDLSLTDRILYNELKWFATVLYQRTPSLPIIQMFLRCVSLHLCASPLSVVVLNETANMLNELRHRLDTLYDSRPMILALRKCVNHLEEALEGCEERDLVERIMEQKTRPMQEYFEAEERGDTTEPAAAENEDYQEIDDGEL
uniref:Condensin-2 complex subunit G2 n=1 Tax=Globodera pallida TaxID=36090 RepID=A0A183C355_GLOPA